MAGILIKNGRVWDGNRFANCDILTDKSKIVKMAPEICEEAAYIYDAEGKLVTPGLVDTHVHMRGISVERFGAQGEMSCFPFGVTAAADAGGKHGDKKLLDSFMLKNVVFVPVDIQNNRADFTNAERKLQEYGDKAIGLKVYFSAASSQAMDTAPLRQTCDFAHTRGLRVMVHCANQPVAMARLLEELRPVRRLERLFKLLEREVEILALDCNVAVVSNKFYNATVELCRHFFADTVEVAIGEREDIRRKPAPDTVFEAMRQLGVTADDTVYVGDSDVDVATARNSGIPCISVLWGFRDRDFLIEHGATTFVNTPEEILNKC